MVVPLYKSNKVWVFRTLVNCPFFCLFVLLSITTHLTAQWLGESLRSSSMTPHQTSFSFKCVYIETLEDNKHYMGVEPNSEVFEEPNASNLIGREHRFEPKKKFAQQRKSLMASRPVVLVKIIFKIVFGWFIELKRTMTMWYSDSIDFLANE